MQRDLGPLCGVERAEAHLPSAVPSGSPDLAKRSWLREGTATLAETT